MAAERMHYCYLCEPPPGGIVSIGANTVEQIVKLHIEKLPEGVYLATSDEVPGLVAQGRTITETLEIARDVAKKLIEAQAERHGEAKLTAAGDSFDYPLIVGS